MRDDEMMAWLPCHHCGGSVDHAPSCCFRFRDPGWQWLQSVVRWIKDRLPDIRAPRAGLVPG